VEYIQQGQDSRRAVYTGCWRSCTRREDAIAKTTKKNSRRDKPGRSRSVSIRGSFGRITTKGVYENVIHCSSDPAELKGKSSFGLAPYELIAAVYPTKTIVLEKVERPSGLTAPNEPEQSEQ